MHAHLPVTDRTCARTFCYHGTAPLCGHSRRVYVPVHPASGDSNPPMVLSYSLAPWKNKMQTHSKGDRAVSDQSVSGNWISTLSPAKKGDFPAARSSSRPPTSWSKERRNSDCRRRWPYDGHRVRLPYIAADVPRVQILTPSRRGTYSISNSCSSANLSEKRLGIRQCGCMPHLRQGA